ncbi:LPXTG cell wall anchor domain-containing protein, partial [Streptomyces sp. NPDC059010]|uniref:LPXTG cell wall anchor domain-containing protein n=1 Tax=Streptomyces sp. NPDC059010 TaxID=3346695 RepID=UPI0036C72C42
EFKMHFSVGSATTDTEGTEPTSDEPSEQGAEPQSDGTKPASSDAEDDTDLAATGGDMGNSLSIAIGALALAVLGGAILMKTRRKRAASSHRAR